MKLNDYKELVKSKYSLTKILNKLYPENQYKVDRTCFCPFHENHNTPAAAIYEENGIETLHCFFEKRNYSSVEALEQLLGYNVYELGKQLWDEMSDDEQNTWLISHGKLDYKKLFSSKKYQQTDKLQVSAEQFKLGKIDFFSFLNIVINENKPQGE